MPPVKDKDEVVHALTRRADAAPDAEEARRLLREALDVFLASTRRKRGGAARR